MAAVSYEPALSASLSRSHISADAPSMADQLPSVNFNFDELRQRMAHFTARFDDFIEKGRRTVLEEKNAFRLNLVELQEDQRQAQRAVEIESMKAQSHASQLTKESAEKAAIHAEISSLTQHRDDLLGRNAQLAAELRTLSTTLSARREAQAKHARYLSSQARHNLPELSFWEDYLCMRIDSAGAEDRLKFVFSHLVEKDWDREGWFELDTSCREYSVTRTEPVIERAEVERLVESLNETRELCGLFKGMRECFAKAMR